MKKMSSYIMDIKKSYPGYHIRWYINNYPVNKKRLVIEARPPHPYWCVLRFKVIMRGDLPDPSILEL